MSLDAFSRANDLTLVCAACRGPALADFVRYCPVRAGDEALFRDLPGITISRRPAPDDGFLACYRPVPGAPDLRDRVLPGTYGFADWAFSLRSSDAVLTCLRCGTVQTRAVSLPEEYFYQVEYRGKPLRAGSRAQAQDLLAFIDGNDRRRKPWKDYTTQQGASFLSRIPTHFLTAKARDIIVKRLRNRLDEGAA